MTLTTTVLTPGPLHKVALLLASALCTYTGLTPPAVPPLPRERLDRAPDVMHWNPRVQIAMFTVYKMVLCGLAVAEAVILLAQWSASITLIHRALAAVLSAANVSLDSIPLRLTSTSVIACLLAVGGGSVRWWCYRTLGRFFTCEIGTRADQKLITSGPYRIVRHPGYAGGFLLIVGSVMSLVGGGSLFTESGLRSTWVGNVVTMMIVAHLASVAAGTLYRTRTEDEMMKREFGKSWDEWSERTPYRIVPFLY